MHLASVTEATLQQFRPRVPAAEAGPDDSLQLGGRLGCVLEGTSQPEHPLVACFSGEATVSPLEPNPGQGALDLAQGELVLAAIANVGQPGFELVGQVESRGISIPWVHCHRLQADCFERRINRTPQPPRGRENPAANSTQHVPHVAVREGVVSDQHAVENRPKAVDVARRANPVQVARGLLGAHITRRPHHRAGLRHRRVRRGPVGADGLARRPSPHTRKQLGDPPIHDESLAERAEHDVLGLQVAMDDPAAVGVCDGIAGVDNAPQKSPERQLLALATLRRNSHVVEPLDRIAKGFALDEVHRVKRPSIGVAAEAVNRHDPRVLQPPGDLRLEQKAGLRRWVVGQVSLQFLEGDGSIQLAVEGDEDFAQATLRMRPQDLEPASFDAGGGRVMRAARGLGDGAVGEREGARPIWVARSDGHSGGRELTCDIGPRCAGQELEISGDALFEACDLGRVEHATAGENIGESPARGTGPRADGGDELFTVDVATLEGPQAEAQVA